VGVMNRNQNGFRDDVAQPYPWETPLEFFDRLFGTNYAEQV